MRFWDLTTESPLHVCKAHKQWVLVISWHPASRYLASACKKGQFGEEDFHFLQEIIFSDWII